MTPAPWTVDEELAGFDRVISDADGGVVALAVSVDGPSTDDPERDSNANILAAAPQLLNALRVFVLDPKLRAWLEAHDPMALAQAQNAMQLAEEGK